MPAARHLLVASLSLLAASTCAQAQYAWVGTYNPNGEGLYRFTVEAKTGALSNRTLVSSLPNVAQLTVSRDGKTLYAASEVEKGAVQAWRVGANGELSELNQVSSGGAGPVYLPDAGRSQSAGGKLRQRHHRRAAGAGRRSPWRGGGRASGPGSGRRGAPCGGG